MLPLTLEVTGPCRSLNTMFGSPVCVAAPHPVTDDDQRASCYGRLGSLAADRSLPIAADCMRQ